jgi:hypothetical protein
MQPGTGTDTPTVREDRRTRDSEVSVPIARTLRDGDGGGPETAEPESNIIRGKDWAHYVGTCLRGSTSQTRARGQGTHGRSCVLHVVSASCLLPLRWFAETGECRRGSACPPRRPHSARSLGGGLAPVMFTGECLDEVVATHGGAARECLTPRLSGRAPPSSGSRGPRTSNEACDAYCFALPSARRLCCFEASLISVGGLEGCPAARFPSRLSGFLTRSTLARRGRRRVVAGRSGALSFHLQINPGRRLDVPDQEYPRSPGTPVEREAPLRAVRTRSHTGRRPAETPSLQVAAG